MNSLATHLSNGTQVHPTGSEKVIIIDLQVEVDLVMETGLSPPPSLGIRVIGVNMIHGVPGTIAHYKSCNKVKVDNVNLDLDKNTNINCENKLKAFSCRQAEHLC